MSLKTMDLSIGNVIRGKYRIDKILGQGGMGIVVGAYHLALDQKVAIKFLLPAMRQQHAVVERFAREARAASKIQSDHVARVMDVDALEDGTPFMVMEYLEGSDLSRVRKSGEALPVHVAAGYLIEASEAVAEAHRVGIVHRDLKPANLFLSRRSDGKQRVKVLDFGISKLAGAAGDASVTSTTTVMGSAEYMAPEQMLSTKDADARSDIWALGVCLYELLTARVPFPGESLTQVCALVLQTRPTAPLVLRPGLPPALDGIVMRCLEKDPARRFATVEALAAALLPFSDAAFVEANHNAAGQPTTDRLLQGAQSPQAPIGFGPPPYAVRTPASPEGGGGVLVEQHPQHGSSPRVFATGPELSTAILDVGRDQPQPSGSSPGFGSHPSLAERTSYSQGSYASPSNPGTQGAFSSSRIGRRPSYAPLFAIAGAVSFAALATVMVFAMRHAEPAGPASSGVVTSAAGVKASSMSATSSVVPTTTNVVVTPSTATATASKPTADKPAGNKPTAKPPSTKSCNPPFTIDASGIKHAKPECL